MADIQLKNPTSKSRSKETYDKNKRKRKWNLSLKFPFEDATDDPINVSFERVTAHDLDALDWTFGINVPYFVLLSCFTTWTNAPELDSMFFFFFFLTNQNQVDLIEDRIARA